MTINTSLVTLGTAAQQVVGPSVEPQFVTMHNMTKSSNEYIFYGNATVGTGNAPHLDPGDTLQLRLLPGEALYALSQPDGLELGVFIQKQDN
jgi:hypothetical protein